MSNQKVNIVKETCWLVDNHVVGKSEKGITFIIPQGLFMKVYGFIPHVKTYGTKLDDNTVLMNIADGDMTVEQVME